MQPWPGDGEWGVHNLLRCPLRRGFAIRPIHLARFGITLQSDGPPSTSCP